MKQKIVCVAGFGDNGSMFESLLTTVFAERYVILPFNLPGFGAPPLSEAVTLEVLANPVASYCAAEKATYILAHSVSSIIATLAARQPSSPIETILSLEGNLTAEDAYFSGTASHYADPLSFFNAFIARLDTMAADQPIISRYRNAVAKAHPRSLWELGKDAFRYSENHVPGEELIRSAKAVYVYNPQNIPLTSKEWLNKSELPKIELEGASHWPSVDQPEMLSEKLLAAISLVG